MIESDSDRLTLIRRLSTITINVHTGFSHQGWTSYRFVPFDTKSNYNVWNWQHAPPNILKRPSVSKQQLTCIVNVAQDHGVLGVRKVEFFLSELLEKVRSTVAVGVNWNVNYKATITLWRRVTEQSWEVQTVACARFQVPGSDFTPSIPSGSVRSVKWHHIRWEG